jgi:molecular chaperone GrpE
MEAPEQQAPEVVEEVAAEEAATEPAPAAEPEAAAPAEPEVDYLALAQRTQADFDNYRKRTQRDLAAAEHRGVTRTVKELLPALDNLERAIAAHPDDQVTEGIRLVHAELTAALARVGVLGYSPKGEPFDPTVHEAMAQHPVDGAESGTVVEVYQQGWRKDDLVIRPARVVVAA